MAHAVLPIPNHHEDPVVHKGSRCSATDEKVNREKVVVAVPSSKRVVAGRRRGVGVSHALSDPLLRQLEDEDRLLSLRAAVASQEAHLDVLRRMKLDRDELHDQVRDAMGAVKQRTEELSAQHSPNALRPAATKGVRNDENPPMTTTAATSRERQSSSVGLTDGLGPFRVDPKSAVVVPLSTEDEEPSSPPATALEAEVTTVSPESTPTVAVAAFVLQLERDFAGLIAATRALRHQTRPTDADAEKDEEGRLDDDGHIAELRSSVMSVEVADTLHGVATDGEATAASVDVDVFRSLAQLREAASNARRQLEELKHATTIQSTMAANMDHDDAMYDEHYEDDFVAE